MAYSDIVATIAIIVSVIAVPASGIISYRYAIRGEKRKEWNVLAEPIYDYFFKRFYDHSNGAFYTRYEIPFAEIIPLRRRFSKTESIVFEKNFVRYVHIRNYFAMKKPMTDTIKRNLCSEAKRLSGNIMNIVKIK